MNRNEVILVLNSSRFGQGNPQLGGKLMSQFLEQTVKSSARPAAVLLYNSAVVLACDPSETTASLKKLADEGVDVLVNTESLEFYAMDTVLRAGKSTPMEVMTERLLNAATVIKP